MVNSDLYFQRSKMNALVMGREFVAELLGTMVLIMFGCGSVAQSVIYNFINFACLVLV